MSTSMLESGENFPSLQIKNIRLNTNPRLDDCSSGFDKNIVTFGYKLSKKQDGFFIIFDSKSTRKSYLRNSKWLKSLKRMHIAPGLDNIAIDSFEYNLSQGLIVPYLNLIIMPKDFYYLQDFVSQEEIILEYVRSGRPCDWVTTLELCRNSLRNVICSCVNNVNAVCNEHIGNAVLLHKMGKESGNLQKNIDLCNLALRNINLCRSMRSRVVLADLLLNFPCALPADTRKKRLQASQIVSDMCCSSFEKVITGKPNNKKEFLANHAFNMACICFEMLEYEAALEHIENIWFLTDGEYKKPSPNKHILRIREANEILAKLMKEKVENPIKPEEPIIADIQTALESSIQESPIPQAKDILMIGDITKVISDNEIEIEVLGRGLVVINAFGVEVYDTDGEPLTSLSTLDSGKHCATLCFDKDFSVKKVFIQKKEQFENDSLSSESHFETKVGKVVTFNPKDDIFGDSEDEYFEEDVNLNILSAPVNCSDIICTEVSEIDMILNDLEEYILTQLEGKHKSQPIAEKRKLANTMADSWRKNQLWLEEFWENTILNSYSHSKGKYLQPKDVDSGLIRDELYKNYNYNPSFNKRQFIKMCGEFFAECSCNYLKEKQKERERPKDSDDELTKSFKLFWAMQEDSELSYDDIQDILQKNNVKIKFLQLGYECNSSGFDQYIKDNLNKLETHEMKFVSIFKSFFKNQQDCKYIQPFTTAPQVNNLNDSIVDIEDDEEEEKDEISTSSEEEFTKIEINLQPYLTTLLQDITNNLKDNSESLEKRELYYSNIKAYLRRGLVLSEELKGTKLLQKLTHVLDTLKVTLSKNYESKVENNKTTEITSLPTKISKGPDVFTKEMGGNIVKEQQTQNLETKDSKEVISNIYKLQDEMSEKIGHNILVDIKEYEEKVSSLSAELKKTPQGKGVHYGVNFKQLNDKLKELRRNQSELSTRRMYSENSELVGLENGVHTVQMYSEHPELVGLENGMQKLDLSGNVMANTQLKSEVENLKQEVEKYKFNLVSCQCEMMDQTHILQKENFSLKLKEKELQDTVNYLRKNQDSALLKALEKNSELQSINTGLASDNECLRKKMEEMESKMKEMAKEQILLEYKLEKAHTKSVSDENMQNKNPLLKHEMDQNKPKIKLLVPKTGNILYLSPDEKMHLPLSLVQKQYPDTTAIKYRLAGGHWRMLILENDHFHPPEEGWGDRVYEIVNQSKKVLLCEEKAEPPPRPTYNPQSYPQPTTIPQIPSMGGLNQPLRPLMSPNPYNPFYNQPPRYTQRSHFFGFEPYFK